ncbi:MAG: formylglycine-generating enzyme family protein, partial [Planctomycetota bacterium]|nr:formylglycine-generating enzyme family protein [Planctomycetota bacterium]
AGNETERLIKVRPSILNDHERWRWASREAQDRVIENLITRVRAPFQYLDTVSYECGERKYRIARFRHKKTGLDLHLVPGGDFNMGIPSFPNESMYVKRVSPKMHKFARRHFKNATPQRRVQMKPFLIAPVELTEEQWAMGKVGKTRVTPKQPKGKLNRSLITEWLRDFPSLRMPSEAEWEYAARAGSNTRYFWGDELDERYLWFNENSGQRIHLVTEHRDATNAFGLSDVIGNLWELVADDFRSDYQIPPTQEPYFQTTKRRKPEHIFRGGGAVNPPISQSLTLRTSFPHGLLDMSYGVRLAVSFNKVFHPNK